MSQEIRLEQAKGINLATREVQLHSHYNIYLDDLKVAIVGFEIDSKVVFLKPNISPLDKEAVLDYVERKLAMPNPEHVEPSDVQKQIEEFDDQDDNEDFVDVSN